MSSTCVRHVGSQVALESFEIGGTVDTETDLLVHVRLLQLQPAQELVRVLVVGEVAFWLCCSMCCFISADSAHVGELR